jgi:nifR3 family TIM-barrel protein
MKIGSLTPANNLVLAPLAGITNLPFRLLAREAGCGLAFSEMISANGLVHGSPKTRHLLDSTPQDQPLVIQIFGSDADIMAEAALQVQAAGACAVDINFGCAVRKIVKTGAGVALMKRPGVAEKLLAAVRGVLRIPLTIKIRTGWEGSGRQALQVAAIAEDCGVNAITVHPRTAGQGFSGEADWSIIAAVKRQATIPVIGNGDIGTPGDAVRMLEATGCDGIMIGRKAIGNPWIFATIGARLKGIPEPDIDAGQRFEMMLRFLRATVDYCGETAACRMLRSRLGWFVKGLPGSSRFREGIKHLSSEAEALDLIAAYRERVCR